jgi:hypothetical protein
MIELNFSLSNSLIHIENTIKSINDLNKRNSYVLYTYIYIDITCALRAYEITQRVDRPLMLTLKQKNSLNFN